MQPLSTRCRTVEFDRVSPINLCGVALANRRLSRRLVHCVFLFCTALFAGISTGYAQDVPPDQKAPDVRTTTPLTTPPAGRKYLLGDWGGERTKLEEHGVVFDFFYQADLLSSPSGGEQTANGGFERVRGTFDMDFEKLHLVKGLTFHATGVWQAGVNLNSQYIGAISNPTSLPSSATTRLDAFWFQQSLFSDKFSIKVGQLPGFDFFDLQEYGGTYMNETMGYSPATNYQNYLSYNPGGTPGTEFVISPVKNAYFKGYVGSGNRNNYVDDPNGFHFVFRNSPVFGVETGLYVHPQPGTSAAGTLGKQEKSSGYLPGLYKVGATYNPGRFTNPTTNVSSLGNYFVYFQADQAVYRQAKSGPGASRGLDVTFQISGAPSDVNRVNYQWDAGARYLGPISSRPADTVSFGIVHSHVSNNFEVKAPITDIPLVSGAENLIEINYLAQLTRYAYFQPFFTYVENPRSISTAKIANAPVTGFRFQVHF